MAKKPIKVVTRVVEATKDYVDFKVANAATGNVDLSAYATVSAMNNALNNKADRINEHTHANKSILDGITANDIANWNSASGSFSGSYNDLTDKPIIPTNTSQLTNDSGFVNQAYVTNAIAGAQLSGGNVDLSNYVTTDSLNAALTTKANTTDIPTRLSQLANDSGYLTSVPSEYALRSEIPSIEGLATETFVTDRIAEAQLGSGSTPDLSGYVTTDDLNSALSTKANTSDVPTNVSQLYNDAGYTNAIEPNFTYKIIMIGPDQSPSVTTTGAYPDLVFTFMIPKGGASSSGSQEGVERMWFGWIPFDQTAYDQMYNSDGDPTGVVIAPENRMGFVSTDEISPEGINKQVIQYGLNYGSLAELDPQVLDKTSTGAFNPDAKYAEDASYVCCIYPKSKNYVVSLDDGIGNKVPFADDVTGYYSQNGAEITNQIDGVTYCMSGTYITNSGERFMYVDEAAAAITE